MKNRVILILVSTLVALIAGVLVPSRWLPPTYQQTAYYFVFTACFLWVVALIKLTRGQLRAVLKEHRLGLILSIGLVILIYIVSAPKFKILADEANLVGVSLAMHQEKMVAIPFQGLQIEYLPDQFTTVPDKRPLLFPFLLSVIHTLAGYSPYNGFVLNFIAGVFILFLFYLLAAKFYPKYLALASIMILASMPNFVIWITSGGFEGINLLFLIIVFHTFHRFNTDKDAAAAEWLFLTLILLVQCRYESIVFLTGVLFIITHIYSKQIYKQFTFVTCLTPLFLVPYLWQRRIFLNTIEPVRIGVDLFEKTNHAFALSSFVSNLPKNIFVLTGLDPNFGFSPVVALLGAIGVYFLARQAIFTSEENDVQLQTVTRYAFVSFSLLLVVLFSYRWGDFTRAVSNRLAMVFLPYIVFAAVHGMHKMLPKQPSKVKIWIFVLSFFHLVYFWPYAAQEKLIKTLAATYEYNHVLHYLNDNFNLKREKILVISDRPNEYIIFNCGSVDFPYANQNRKDLVNYRRTYFDHILVFQRYAGKSGRPLRNNRLDPGYRLKEIKKITVSAKMSIRISEIQ